MNHKLPGRIRQLSSIPVVGPAVKRAYTRHWYKRFMQHRDEANVEAIRKFQENALTPTAVQARVVRDLNEKGIAFAQIDELLTESDAPLWPKLQQTISEWLGRPESLTGSKTERYDPKKSYIIRYYGNGANIKSECALLRLGLSPSILNVVNSYLGLWSKLNYVDAWNTVPEPKHNDSPIASQRWHRDPEDIKLCKIFLYQTDVDDGAGPLNYLPNCRPGERYGNLWPQELPSSTVVADTEFEAKVPRSDWVTCKGKTGTIVFVDTVGFHMGGRASTKNRVFSHWTFTSPGSHWPRSTFFEPDVIQSYNAPAARWAMQCGRLH